MRDGSNNNWVYLDPDNRKNPPETLHCCRCMRTLKDTPSFTSFISVEVHREHPWVRKSILGRQLIGSDCWNKIKGNIVEDDDI